LQIPQMSHKNRPGDPSTMLRKYYKTRFARRARLTSCYILSPNLRTGH